MNVEPARVHELLTNGFANGFLVRSPSHKVIVFQIDRAKEQFTNKQLFCGVKSLKGFGASSFFVGVVEAGLPLKGPIDASLVHPLRNVQKVSRILHHLVERRHKSCGAGSRSHEQQSSEGRARGRGRSAGWRGRAKTRGSGSVPSWQRRTRERKRASERAWTRPGRNRGYVTSGWVWRLGLAAYTCVL